MGIEVVSILTGLVICEVLKFGGWVVVFDAQLNLRGKFGMLGDGRCNIFQT